MKLRISSRARCDKFAPFEPEHAGAPVRRVSGDGQVDRLEVDADLGWVSDTAYETPDLVKSKACQVCTNLGLGEVRRF